MTDEQKIQEIVSSGRAPLKVAHPSDPKNPFAGKTALVPYDGSEPQPGDQFQFSMPDGIYTLSVDQDGGWVMAGSPKAPTKQAPTDVLTSSDISPNASKVDPAGSKIVDHLAAQLKDPDLSQAMRDTIYPQYATALNALRGEIAKAGTVDANTQGLAQSAEEKIRSGIRPSVTELAALNRVRTAAGGSSTPSAMRSGPVTDAIDGVTDDERVRAAMKLGASLEGGLGSSYGAGDGGGSWGPFQINHNSGMHADISREESENPAKAAQYMLKAYQDAVGQVPDSLWTSNPKQAAARAAFLAERPAKMYDASRVDSSWNALTGGSDFTLPPPNKQHVTVSGKEYVFDPATGEFTDPGIGRSTYKPDTIERNGITYQYNSTSQKWEKTDLPPDDAALATAKKLQQETLGKAQLALSQQYDTVQYIKAQIAAGNMTPAEADGYLNEVKAQTHAALAGTTPEAIWAKAQDIETARAAQAKDLLDTQVQQGAALTDALLSHALPNASDKLLVNPSVPFDYNDVMGAAKANIRQYIPEGLNDTATQLLQTAWGPQEPAPGQTDSQGNLMAPNGGLPPGAYIPAPGTDDQQEVAA